MRLSDNIRGQVWSKLLINSTWSGLGVASGLLYGEIAEHPLGRGLAVELWREGVEVGHAQGLVLPELVGVAAEDVSCTNREISDRAIDKLIGQLGATKASMLQDVEHGVPCEVDVINGAVVHRVGARRCRHAAQPGAGRDRPRLRGRRRRTQPERCSASRQRVQ